MANEITVFAPESGSLTYKVKDRTLSISPEGAMFKGGKELTLKLRDAAVQSAFVKAGNGRYRAAADILGAAFPAALKRATEWSATDDPLWTNKTLMGNLLHAVEVAEAKLEEKGKAPSVKQVEALGLLGALRMLPAFEPEKLPVPVTVDNEAKQPA